MSGKMPGIVQNKNFAYNKQANDLRQLPTNKPERRNLPRFLHPDSLKTKLSPIHTANP